MIGVAFSCRRYCDREDVQSRTVIVEKRGNTRRMTRKATRSKCCIASLQGESASALCIWSMILWLIFHEAITEWVPLHWDLRSDLLAHRTRTQNARRCKAVAEH